MLRFHGLMKLSRLSEELGARIIRIIKKGAEASLILAEWHGNEVILKHRTPKAYRVPELDLKIRRQRTIHEARLLHSAKTAGVPTPLVYFIDLKNTVLVMEYIEGKVLRDVIEEFEIDRRRRICMRIGELIGRLHKFGIVHGDLTTSNMILTQENEVCLVDFGLGGFTTELEQRGIDLHLMERALKSTHFEVVEEMLNDILRGYEREVGRDVKNDVVKRMREIDRRGRYVKER